MGTANTILYQTFTTINLVGCVWAITSLYKHFHDGLVTHVWIKRYVLAMIACLFTFAIYQLNSYVMEVFLPWTAKLGITIFFIKSLIFTKIAGLLRQTNQTGL